MDNVRTVLDWNKDHVKSNSVINTDLIIVEIIRKAADKEFVSRVWHDRGHHSLRKIKVLITAQVARPLTNKPSGVG